MFNTYTGIPGFFYRSASTVRREIKKITAEIEEIIETVNVREILMEMLTECLKHEPQKWMTELIELVDATEKSAERLRVLDALLAGLLTEWREVKCAVTV